jgi:hypothetical protein
MIQVLRTSFGSLAIFAAIRRADKGGAGVLDRPGRRGSGEV